MLETLGKLFRECGVKVARFPWEKEARFESDIFYQPKILTIFKNYDIIFIENRKRNKKTQGREVGHLATLIKLKSLVRVQPLRPT